MLHWLGRASVSCCPKQREAHRKGLSEVADLIRHYATIETIFRQDPASETWPSDSFKETFENHIVELYSHILEYEARSVCQLSRNTIMQNFAVASTWEELLVTIHEADSKCAKNIHSLDSFHTASGFKSVSEMLRSQDDFLQAAFHDFGEKLQDLQVIAKDTRDMIRRENVMAWLAPDAKNREIDQRRTQNAIKGKRQKGTGMWFTEGQFFQDWLKSQELLLWVFGPVGCGKTVLCTSIVDKMQSVCDTQTAAQTVLESAAVVPLKVVYFYMTFNPLSVQDRETFLRSVLVQLQPKESLLAPVSDLYDNTFPLDPTYENFLDVLESITQDQNESLGHSLGQIFMIIDGVDEISNTNYQRDLFLGMIEHLSSGKSSRLKIIVVSRPEPDIAIKLAPRSGWTHYQIPFVEVQQDIKEFAKAQIEGHFKLSLQSDAVKDVICTSLSEDVHGMFRLADLRMQELKRLAVYLDIIPLAKIYDILNRIPQELNQFYLRILEGIPKDLVMEISTVLKWVVLSQRPLYIEEVTEACMIDISDASFNEARYITTRTIVKALPGIVQLEPSVDLSVSADILPRTHILSLAHFSVLEFLVPSNQIADLPGLGKFEIALNHGFVAKSCLVYLLYAASRDSYPLKSYAWLYWAAHATTTTVSPSTAEQLAGLRLFNEIAFPLLYSLQNREVTSSLLTRFPELLNTIAEPQQKELLTILQDPRLSEDILVYDHLPLEPDETRPMTVPYTYHHNGPQPSITFRPLLNYPLMVRIIIVHPSKDRNAPVNCSLCVDSLQNFPSYTALAYTWGSNANHQTVLVNGKIIWVRGSLHSALQMFRLEDEPRAIWGDAISINMEDGSERSSQVKHMPTIYSQAEEVCIWLGNTNSEQNFVAFDFFKMPIRERKIYSKSRGPVYVDGIGGKDSLRNTLDEFFDAPYWRRCWMVQEAVMARKLSIQWGSAALDWADLPDVLLLHEETKVEVWSHFEDIGYVQRRSGDIRVTGKGGLYAYHLGWKAIETIQYLRKKYARTPEAITLPELLQLTRYHFSSDARDRVFALYSLLPEPQRNQPLLQPDYSLTYPEVFIKAALYILAEHKNLDILSLCSSIPENYRHAIHEKRRKPRFRMALTSTADSEIAEAPTSLETLPSWVPAWNTDTVSALAPGIFAPNRTRMFNAGGPSADFSVEISGGIHVLNIKGAIIDSVYDARGVVVNFEDKCIHSLKIKSTTDTMSDLTASSAEKSKVDTFWRTVLMDRWVSSDGTISRISPNVPGIPETFPTDPVGERELKHIIQNRREKDLLGFESFVSSKGRAGMIPWDAEPEDIIVVFLGAQVPFVLRKSIRHDKKFYKLIGECYLHGLMDGQVLDEKEKYEWQNFPLI
ncbi:heterokaryon incompatibility protein-domain-containing protein [Cadophora sp. MPI-SDFR-AT-0126]|nr:heterokaryon incompatibility protein-domain-containing protein [Leotiomycetes sp. MPI-SDFR-AT-0126]